MKLFACALAAVVAGVGYGAMEAEPYTCHWTGQVNSNWWNPGNWAEGKVPGVWTSDGGLDGNGNPIVLTNGCRGCTAVFGRVPNNNKDQRRLIQPNPYTFNPDKSGMMLSIGNVIFDAAEDPAHPDYVEVEYVVNQNLNWIYGEPYLPLEGGARIEVTANTTKTVWFKSSLTLGSLETSAKTFTLANWSSTAVLSIQRLTCWCASYNYGRAPSIGWMTHDLKFEGSGEIDILANSVSTSGYEYCPNFAMTGGKVVFPNGFTAFRIKSTFGKGEQVVEIPAGKTFQLGCDNSTTAELYTDVRFTGDGTFKVQSGSGANRQFTVNSNALVTVETAFGNRQTSGTYCGELPGFWLNGNGRFQQTGANQIEGAVEIYGAEYIASAIGKVGVADGIGKGQRIKMGSEGRLRYTGNGETTDKFITLAGGGGTIIQAGFGAVTFDHVVADYTDYILVISNETAAAVGFSGDVGCNMRLLPTSKARFSVPDGEDSATIALTRLSFVGEGSELEIEDGVSVTVTRFLPNSSEAVVNIVTGENSSLILPDVAVGFNRNLRLNGQRARVDSLGIVKSLADDDCEIAAHDDTVPDLPGATVAITSAGSESGSKDTLETDAVSVGVLRNRIDTTTPVIELGENQTLTSSLYEIADGATPIVFTGPGSLTGDFELQGTIVRANETDELSVTLSAPTGAKLQLAGAVSTDSPADIRVKEGKATLTTSGGEVPAGALVESAQHPVLVIDGSDTVIAGNVFVGKNAAGYNGAVYQLDGMVKAPVNDGYIVGAQGYGYYLLEGGVYTNSTKSVYVGAYGVAILEMTGGQFFTSAGGAFTARAYTDGLTTVYQSGGTLMSANDTYDLCLDASQGGDATWTITGEGTKAMARCRNLALGNYHVTGKESYAIVNLNNGGMLHTGSVVAGKNHTAHHHAFLNFNGGVLYNNYAWGDIFGHTGTQWFDQIDRVTSFEGGATLYTQANNSVYVPVSAPTGKGVETVTWSAAATTTLIGPPSVVITGDGEGATAYAHFDRTTGRVTFIEVTSPGWDYTEAEAVLYYGNTSGGPTEIGRAVCTLKDNVSGGLTRKGSNILTFKAGVHNTYTGPTVIESGTIALEDDNQFAAASALVLKGGSLDLQNHSQTFSDIDCGKGTVANGKVTVSGLAVDLDAALDGTLKSVNFNYCTLANDAPVTLKNYEASKLAGKAQVRLIDFRNGTPTALDFSGNELPADWSFTMKNGILVLKRTMPTLLLVK